MEMFTQEQRRAYVDEYLKAKAEGRITSIRDYCRQVGLNDTTFGGWLNHDRGLSKSYTPEERESHINEFLKEKAESGCTIRAYSAKAGINVKTMGGWLEKYRAGVSPQDDGRPLVRIPSGNAGAPVAGMVRIEYYGAVITVAAGDLPMVLAGIRNA